jgi:hypothetical protein
MLIQFHDSDARTKAVSEKERLQMIKNYPGTPEANECINYIEAQKKAAAEAVAKAQRPNNAKARP